MIHSKKTVIKESISTAFLDDEGGIMKHNNASVILPPSKVFIGKRLSIPKDTEAKIKNSILEASIRKLQDTIYIIIADKKLNNGPKAHNIISFEYEIIFFEK